jgi:hypothetical protein
MANELELELQQVAEYLVEREARQLERNRWIADAMEAAFSSPNNKGENDDERKPD